MHAATTSSIAPGRSSAILPLALGALLVGCAPKSALRAPLPEQGDPVRVTTGDHREVYELRELRGDVLVVQKYDTLRSIPMATVDGLEVLVERQSHAAKYAAGGFAGGAAIGFGYSLFIGSMLCSSGLSTDCPPAGEAGREALHWGTAGAVLGLIIGSTRHSAVWPPVDTSAWDVQAEASAGGLGLQLTWRP